MELTTARRPTTIQKTDAATVRNVSKQRPPQIYPKNGYILIRQSLNRYLGPLFLCVYIPVYTCNFVEDSDIDRINGTECTRGSFIVGLPSTIFRTPEYFA